MEMKKITLKKTDFNFYAQVIIILILGLFLILNWNGEETVNMGNIPVSSIIPTGVPAVYGEELGISFDDVSPSNAQKTDSTIRLLGNIDRSETLEGSNLERYINILYTLEGGISCEYCCGARSIIFENGEPACGCAHSYAMRGITKYLIKFHGDEYTDKEILEQVGKWKILFFPGIIQGKANIMENQGLPTDIVSLTSNKYRNIEKGQASGGMVGGC